jgi:hypothetical protein
MQTVPGVDDWLTIFKRNRQEFIEATSTHDYQWTRNHALPEKNRAYRERQRLARTAQA